MRKILHLTKEEIESIANINKAKESVYNEHIMDCE